MDNIYQEGYRSLDAKKKSKTYLKRYTIRGTLRKYLARKERVDAEIDAMWKACFNLKLKTGVRLRIIRESLGCKRRKDLNKYIPEISDLTIKNYEDNTLSPSTLYLKLLAAEVNKRERIKKGKQMLIITRKLDEMMCIGDDVKITILDIRGKQVRIGLEAPKDVVIHREEVYRKVKEEKDREEFIKKGIEFYKKEQEEQ